MIAWECRTRLRIGAVCRAADKQQLFTQRRTIVRESRWRFSRIQRIPLIKQIEQLYKQIRFIHKQIIIAIDHQYFSLLSIFVIAARGKPIIFFTNEILKKLINFRDIHRIFGYEP